MCLPLLLPTFPPWDCLRSGGATSSNVILLEDDVITQKTVSLQIQQMKWGPYVCDPDQTM